MTFTATYRDRTGAEYKKAAMAAGRLLYVVLYALLICAAGCNRMPAPASADDLRKACCVFSTDSGRLIGGGVFVGIEDDGRQRMFCLTALHVAVMTDSEHTGSFYRQSGSMRLHVAGKEREEIKIEPRFDENRWFAESSHRDVAWVEIAPTELASWRDKGADIRFLFAGKSLAEPLQCRPIDDFIAGASVLRHSEAGKAGLSDESQVCFSLPRRICRPGMTCAAGGVTNALVCLKSNSLENVGVEFNDGIRKYLLKTKQLVARTSTLKGDSGSPVFVNCMYKNHTYPFLLGLVSATNDDIAETSIMPLDEVFPVMGKGLARNINAVLECCEVNATR